MKLNLIERGDILKLTKWFSHMVLNIMYKIFLGLKKCNDELEKSAEEKFYKLIYWKMSVTYIRNWRNVTRIWSWHYPAFNICRISVERETNDWILIFYVDFFIFWPHTILN